MPYIAPDDAERIRNGNGNEEGRYEADTPEELAFVLCDVIDTYVDTRGNKARTHIEVFGALAETDMEFRRRIAKPYEAAKLAEHDPDADPFLYARTSGEPHEV